MCVFGDKRALGEWYCDSILADLELEVGDAMRVLPARRRNELKKVIEREEKAAREWHYELEHTWSDEERQIPACPQAEASPRCARERRRG
jgi:hypothetical protein